MARKQFLSEMEQRVSQFDERLERLASRPLPKSDRARQERERLHFHLMAARAELRERLRHANSYYTPDESWREFKEAMQSVYDGMAAGLDRALSAEEADQARAVAV